MDETRIAAGVALDKREGSEDDGWRDVRRCEHAGNWTEERCTSDWLSGGVEDC